MISVPAHYSLLQELLQASYGLQKRYLYLHDPVLRGTAWVDCYEPDGGKRERYKQCRVAGAGR